MPVTIAAWVYVDAVPSQPQTVLAASFTPDNGKVRVTLGISPTGHMQVIYQQKGSDAIVVTDEKSIPAGRWIHYAMVFWFDERTGALTTTGALTDEADEAAKANVYLFRDAQRIKGKPSKADAEPDLGTPVGISLGGLYLKDGTIKEGFAGRIDEVRIWKRALYNPINNKSYTSPDIDFWRRLPGVTFDEYVYWSFDNHTKDAAEGLCNSTTCSDLSLPIQGPAWIPNDLNIDYSE